MVDMVSVLAVVALVVAGAVASPACTEMIFSVLIQDRQQPPAIPNAASNPTRTPTTIRVILSYFAILLYKIEISSRL